MDDLRSQTTSTMEHGRDHVREQGQQAMGQSKHAMEHVEQLPVNLYYGGVIASIVVSALLFITGKRNLGIFVGLWPPTLLNLALFTKQLRPSREVDRAMDRM